ncbi:MAG: transposase domain-containing protein [Burkholderiaceae bacterium]
MGQAVAYTGKASSRKRRLPTEQVARLVIALALYRHQSHCLRSRHGHGQSRMASRICSRA